MHRAILSTLMITVFVMICTLGMVGVVDVYCASDIDLWLPLYPDAEFVETTQGGLFRPRATGITVQTYLSSDSQREINRWYLQYRRDTTSRLQEERQGAAISRTAIVDYQLDDTPDGKTHITYYSECAGFGQ